MSKKEYKIGTSMLTHNIYAGTTSKEGVWKSKTEVTDSAIMAVALHLFSKEDWKKTFVYAGKEFEIVINGIKEEAGELRYE